MEVTPPENVRRFVDVGAGGDRPDGYKEEEGRVRTSHVFRVRSSPPVDFVHRGQNRPLVEYLKQDKSAWV